MDDIHQTDDTTPRQSLTLPPPSPQAGSPTSDALGSAAEQRRAINERIERERREERERQRAGLAQRSWETLRYSIGRRYELASLGNFDVSTPEQRAVIDELRGYADNISTRIGDGQNVILLGSIGTGKTHLGVAILKAALRAKFTAAATDGQELFGEARDAIAQRKEEADFLRQWRSPDVLQIDDPVPVFGAVTDWQAGLLFRIVDRRARDLKPTIVTLNATDGADAAAKLSPQVWDRLKDGALILRLAWPSYRKPSAA